MAVGPSQSDSDVEMYIEDFLACVLFGIYFVFGASHFQGLKTIAYCVLQMRFWLREAYFTFYQFTPDAMRKSDKLLRFGVSMLWEGDAIAGIAGFHQPLSAADILIEINKVTRWRFSRWARYCTRVPFSHFPRSRVITGWQITLTWQNCS